VNLVVLKGAFIYRDENGEKRVGPGEFIRIPGGHRHWSGSDAKEGAVFYMHQQERMDQKAVK
jgi:quercetin dioxygenase-like cupin family protein